MPDSSLFRWLRTRKDGENPDSPPSDSPQGQGEARPPAPPPAQETRIQWTDVPVSSPRRARPAPPPEAGEQPPPQRAPKKRPPAPPPAVGGIDWGGKEEGRAEFDPAALIGVEDAFEHTPLLAGEKVAFCAYDKVAYHLSTWEFLRARNGGACCICGRTGTIRPLQLPGGEAPSAPAPTTAPAPATAPRPLTLPGEVIRLEDVPDYLGRAVTVQAFVHEVYRTKATGTVFVRFAPRAQGEAPYEGFKLVIFQDYQAAWSALGINLLAYRGKTIRVRGIVQKHPKWGIEILVNSPRVIQVIEDAVEKG